MMDNNVGRSAVLAREPTAPAMQPDRSGPGILPGTTPKRPKDDEYAQLKRLVADQNLLERRPRRYIGPMLGLLALLAVVVAGVLVTRDSWWVMAWTVPAALLFGQLGFLAHDAAHNQVLRSSGKNYVLGVLVFNLGLGGSRGWWADKHNIHHAQPNRLDADPDIDGGVIAVSVEQTKGAQGVARVVMRHQAAGIWPLLTLGILQIHLYSIGFVLRRSLRNAATEAGLLLAHYVVYLGSLILVLGPGRGLLFALVHQLLMGFYLGAAFLPNHVGMPVLQPDEDVAFLRRQVLTSRNMRAGHITDYVFGALSCQIEHHLFPAMPRYTLRKAAPIARRFCEERGIHYHETGVLEAYREVYLRLKSVALDLRRRSGPRPTVALGDTPAPP